jgi:4'-phosphopantetheinyl transferase
MLSADERSYADRFYIERDRRRYIVSRGLLRQILSRYLALDGRDLVFRYGEWGKPALAD